MNPPLPFLAFCLYAIDRSTLLLIDEMNVGVVGDCNIRMPKQLADSLDIFSCSKQSACKSVSKRVKPVNLFFRETSRNSNPSQKVGTEDSR